MTESAESMRARKTQLGMLHDYRREVTAELSRVTDLIKKLEDEYHALKGNHD